MISKIFSPQVIYILMLCMSNMVMTYAWYGHLKNMNSKAWYIAAVVSWAIALLEYMIMVPANRIGYQVFTLPQMKIIQEVISLSIFIPFAMFFMGHPINKDYFFACLCMLGAVYFMFRKG